MYSNWIHILISYWKLIAKPIIQTLISTLSNAVETKVEFQKQLLPISFSLLRLLSKWKHIYSFLKRNRSAPLPPNVSMALGFIIRKYLYSPLHLVQPWVWVPELSTVVSWGAHSWSYLTRPAGHYSQKAGIASKIRTNHKSPSSPSRCPLCPALARLSLVNSLAFQTEVWNASPMLPSLPSHSPVSLTLVAIINQFLVFKSSPAVLCP